MAIFDELGVRNPVLAAPMAGGPTTPELVRAAAEVGSLGFLAGGYRTAAALAAQITAVRAHTDRFGVNLFVPNPVPVGAEAFRRYAQSIDPEGREFGLELAGAAIVEDEDEWPAKIERLLADPVPLVSFTFGLPDPEIVAALRRAGTLTVQTVTSPEEARAALGIGVDALAVQSAAAGGHWGTLTPARPPASLALPELVAAVRAGTGRPIIAAGGVATPAAVRAARRAGADLVMVGTALLRSPEAGTSAVHRAALADPDRGGTVVTHAFTGRPARALPNRFIADHDRRAPLGYPALHHLTSPLRRAAAAAGDPERVHLWAGTGYRAATEEPAATILLRLAGTEPAS